MGWQFWLVAGVGGFALLMGVLMLVTRLRVRFQGAVAEGRVVDHKVSTSQGDRSGRSVKLYAPIVEFSEGHGIHRFTSTLATQAAFPRGSKVMVRYLPADPANTAEIGTGLRMFAFPVAALVAGAVFVAMAFAIRANLGPPV